MTVGGRGFQCKPVKAVGRPEGRGYHGDYGNKVTLGYAGALPPAPALMVLGREDVEYDPGGEGVEVPDRIHSGYGSPSLWECLLLGPHAFIWFWVASTDHP